MPRLPNGIRQRRPPDGQPHRPAELALTDLAGLTCAMQAVLAHSEIEPVETDAWESLGRAIDDKLQEARDALFSLTLALSGDTQPTEPLRDSIERLADVRAMKVSKKKLKRAEQALLNAPTQGPWDTLHKLYP